MSTLVAAAPESGIGIIALTNADNKAESILKVVEKIIEKAFGSRNSSSPVTRRSNPLSPRHHAGVAPRKGDDVDLTGTYYDAGYGTVVLCGVHSTSPSCKCVLEAFHSIDPSLSPKSTSTDLFASWATLLSTHIRLTYTNNGYYLISAGSIYPQGYGKNTTAFSTLDPVAKAEFVVKNGKAVGFGLNGIDDGGVKRSGSVEETSEVWFAKQG